MAKINTTSKGEICFVIMPFGGYFDIYYNGIYWAAITNSGLTPRRADDLFRPSSIIQDIWELTKNASIILADLTGKNPNVFYELGLAHALAKPAILITETMEDIPFDLRGLRIIVYNKNEPNWGATLQESIEKAIQETRASPNTTIPATFLDSNRSDIATPKVSHTEKEILELKQELESLKRMIVSSRSVSSDIVTSRSVGAEATNYAYTLINLNVKRNEAIERIAVRFAMPLNTATYFYELALGKGGPPDDYSYAMSA